MFDSLEDVYEWHLEQSDRRKNIAIGLDACRWLVDFCEQRSVESVLDCGSGMSTLAIRWWAEQADHAVTTVTTDHERRWLTKTRSECEELGLDTDHFYFHDCLFREMHDEMELEEFDVVFMDLASPYRRIAEISRLDGVTDCVVLDDWQFDDYRKIAGEEYRGRGYQIEVLSETEDEFGRLMALAERME